MHINRWITALIALPFLILLIIKGSSTIFAFVAMIICAIALGEYYAIVLQKHTPKISFYTNAMGYLAGILIVLLAHLGLFQQVVVTISVTLLWTGFLSVLRFKRSPDAPDVAVKQIFGLLYIPLPLAFMVMLRNGNEGTLWIALLLWVIASGDIGAFYIGSYLGRRKLCPAVSPKKTIEGAMGGIIANALSAVAFKLLFFKALDWTEGFFFAIAIGTVGQVGDLFESEFKRVSGVKDSGKLLPGHGGILDRIDALLFAAPLAFVLREYLLS
jgi:phosphatidate cytidylyltransferase